MIRYGFCALAIVPLRAEASEKSEMVSQLLFGDTFEILEEDTKWVKIRMTFDSYEGWADKKQLTETDEPSFHAISRWKNFLWNTSVDIFCNQEKLPIVRGSVLPSREIFNVSGNYFQFSKNNPQFVKNQDIITLAKSYIGTPYLWGGRSPFGIDCSGFVQIVFKMAGIFLLRDASQQAAQGNQVDWIADAKPCDLAFFDNEEGRITHVGLFLGDGKIIHASGSVRIDLLDHNGIFNAELNAYTHKLRLIKRMWV